jgi:hypothetical protein
MKKQQSNKSREGKEKTPKKSETKKKGQSDQITAQIEVSPSPTSLSLKNLIKSTTYNNEN